MTTTVCIGVGNPFRNDDGVGVEIVRSLQETMSKPPLQDSLPPTDFVEASGEGTELINTWASYDQVYIFDAVMHQGNTGRIHRLEASSDRLPMDFFKYSSHAFSLAEAVEMSRVLNRLPKKLVVFGVEGENFSFGDTLSPSIVAAAKKVVDEVISELRLTDN